MENGQLHDDKLFRAVHDRLSDYEAPYNGADWDAMSRSLDALPKTARFQWKISLNSILVVLGVIGLSAIGYAIATHSGNSNSKHPVQQNSVTTNDQPQNNSSVALNTSSQISTNSSLASHQQSILSTQMNDISTNQNSSQTVASNPANTTIASADVVKKTRKHGDSSLYFGDQIDPKKGFIYGTQENKGALTPPANTEALNVYYDMDNGHVKKITRKDSSTVKTEKKNFPSDSTASNKAGAPTNGETSDFGPNPQ